MPFWDGILYIWNQKTEVLKRKAGFLTVLDNVGWFDECCIMLIVFDEYGWLWMIEDNVGHVKF